MTSLSTIKRGREKRPIRAVIYGVDGIGKSMFAARYRYDAPTKRMVPTEATEGVVFIPTEDGVHGLDVPRWDILKSWSEIFGCIGTLYGEEHGYHTVVLDSVDFAEPLLWAEVCAENGVEALESIGYGKGYKFGREKFIKLLEGLDALWMRGMNVIVLGHSRLRKFDDPSVPEPYERYTLKLDEQNEAKLREWADDVLFCNYDTTISTKKDGMVETKRAVSYGKRYLYTERTAAFDAKNRHSLPARLPLDWAAFEEAFNNSHQ